MRKIYLSLVLASSVSLGLAQSGVVPFKADMKKSKSEVNPQQAKKSSVLQAKGATLWEDDFSDPLTWTTQNTSSPAQDWVITTDVNDIPAASQTTGLYPAGHSSASTGYALIDSDGAGAAAVQNCQITSDTIDLNSLTSATNFTLQFEHSYRTFEDGREVRVSPDGGMTWTTYVVTTTANAEANVNTGNPDIYRINITNAVYDGVEVADSVLIQFHYEGNWGWFWAIDEVKITETDANDVAAGAEFTADINNDFQYTQIPLAQARPLSFGLEVLNTGVNDQSTTITYDIMSGGSSVDAGSSAASTVVSADLDTLFHTTSFTPSALGLYTLDLEATIATDDNPGDNVVATVDHIEVTDNIWAHDDGSFSRSFSQLFNEDSTSVFKIGNQFLVAADDTAWTVQIGLYNSTDGAGVGELMFAEIYKWDGTAWALMEVTAEHVVSNSDMGQWVELAFNDGVQLLTGDQVAVVACHYGGDATQRIRFAGGGRKSAQQIGMNADGSGAWGFSGGAEPPHVRLNLDKDAWIAASVEENAANFAVGQNYPNPFNGNTNVNITLNSTEEVMVEITDISGKVIAVMNEGTLTAGNHTIEINSNGLSAGTYYYSVITSTGKVTKAMTVAK